jgi:hypothetical protein
MTRRTNLKETQACQVYYYGVGVDGSITSSHGEVEGRSQFIHCVDLSLNPLNIYPGSPSCSYAL